MPDFYGFVPDSPRLRTVMFVTMILLSAVQVLLKTILILCLGSIKTTYIWLFIGSDMVVYLGYKLFRGDSRYWLPIDGAPGLVVSGLNRVLVKTVTDYTGIIQFRHPYEVRWSIDRVMKYELRLTLYCSLAAFTSCLTYLLPSLD